MLTAGGGPPVTVQGRPVVLCCVRYTMRKKEKKRWNSTWKCEATNQNKTTTLSSLPHLHVLIHIVYLFVSSVVYRVAFLARCLVDSAWLFFFPLSPTSLPTFATALSSRLWWKDCSCEYACGKPDPRNIQWIITIISVRRCRPVINPVRTTYVSGIEGRHFNWSNMLHGVGNTLPPCTLFSFPPTSYSFLSLFMINKYLF